MSDSAAEPSARARGASATARHDARELAEPAEASTMPGLAATMRSDSKGQAASWVVERGALVGRYVTIDELGVGGMGVVWAAYDPELDRKVALKLLHASVASGIDGPARLLREARALARLSHPNVVAVHDVGTIGDRVWLAMEYVDGVTLDAWLKRARPGWVAILRALTAAGRGLAAAHAEGLIHRDVKPENIMIDGDGRVRVMDLGLVRAVANSAAGDDDPSLVDPLARAAGANNHDPERAGAPAPIATTIVAATTSTVAPAPATASATAGERAALSSSTRAPSTSGPSARLRERLSFESPRSLAARSSSDVSMSVRLTTVGSLVGTPAYMAPEQIRGLPGDKRTDVFGFCVTLWEALYGARPFTGRTLVELGAAISAGAITPPASRRGVPRWVQRIVTRGLAAAPEERWPSMAALLDALTRGRARARRRRALAGLGLVGLAVVGALAWRVADERGRVAACAREGAAIEEVWPGREASVTAGLATIDAAYIAATSANLGPQLERWTADWSDVVRSSCEAATVERALAPDLYERARACHDNLRVQVDALLRRLGEGDETVARNALPAIMSLPRPSGCADARLLERELWPAPELRASVIALRQERTRAQSLRAAGDYAGALEVGEAARGRAEALGWAPLVAEMRLLVGSLRWSIGDYAAAEEELRAAYFSAGGMGSDPVAAAAASELVLLTGMARGRPRDGLEWGAQAQLFLERQGDERSLLRATVLRDIAKVQTELGAYDEALRLHAESAALFERAYGPDHPQTASSLSAQATVHERLGEFRRARELLQRARAIQVQAFGAEHPVVATTNFYLASVQTRLGEYDEALRLYERALTTWREALGEEHSKVATALSSMGSVYETRGELDRAMEMHERALAIRERVLDPVHADIAASLVNIGSTLSARGSVDEALEYYRRAHAILVETRGPEHPDTAQSLNNQAILHLQRGDHERGIELHREALAIRERALGPEHPDYAQSLNNLAYTLSQRGRSDEAAPLNERVLELWERAYGPDHPSVATALNNLASTRYDQGRHDEALALNERALAIREAQLGPDHPHVAYSLTNLGKVAIAQGRHADAVAPLERALQIRSEPSAPARLRATTRFALARALVDQRATRARALELARQAAEELAAAADADPSEREEVERWLRSRGARRSSPPR
ncbi:MAG: tetratricopeptide repeat protein [Myxococcales bacterium]|nr:tetratricopeptide repeat protein [Myxococcales bacterium]